VLVGAGSIYRILPCDEAAAMRAIETLARAELKLISLPPEKALKVSFQEVEAEFDSAFADDEREGR
jgi:hypothetical protein